MKAIRVGACALAFAVVLNGCHSHVMLSAPPPTAPEPARVEAYKKLHALSHRETQVTYYNQLGMAFGGAHYTDYMQLADGTRVYYPEDVIPLVGEDSVTGKAADSSRSKRSLAGYLGLAAAATIIAGAAIAFSSFGSDDGNGPDKTKLFVGAGIAVGGGLGFSFGSQAVASSAQDEAATAYETYNDNLSRRLRLQREPEVEKPAPQPEANAK